MIRRIGELFILETENTSYIIKIIPTGQAEHLYYGRKIHVSGEENIHAFREKHAFPQGNSVVYDQDHISYSLEDISLEYSGPGKGDYREPAVEIVHSDGSRTCDFIFDSQYGEENEIKGNGEIKEKSAGLPHSYAEAGKKEHLTLLFREKSTGLALELHYMVYPECDTITRYTRLINESGVPVQIEKIMSMCLDIPRRSLFVHSFRGSWAREMKHIVTPAEGKYVIESRTGNSSNTANPFFMVSDPGTGENQGECFGFNLIYSGNHYEAVEVSPFGKIRIVSGINPQGFSWKLGPGESFDSPEAVMTFSCEGFNGISHNMHRFIRHHVIRGYWKERVRPVLFNSWEACYFKINEKKILNLAREAKKLGGELVVMDDGWFGKRNDDTSSLGDWSVNPEKFPRGLDYVSRKINETGLGFGLWVEPEMVNVNSDLYRAHPEWVLDIPGRPHSEGRNQRILNLSRKDVQDYLIRTLSDLFSSCNLSYVKWDMNRNMSDVYSKALPPERQGETGHRYILGLYRVMDALTRKFPQILFEGCASGGDRFDPGILCYFPQIWASDDTDAIERTDIQQGYSYGYPPVSIGAHVSASPNHQTLRRTPLSTRINVASFGALGFELNPSDLSSSEIEEIKNAVENYKSMRELFQLGRFYRVSDDGDCVTWNVVSDDRKAAAGVLIEKHVHPDDQYRNMRVLGLMEDKEYTVKSLFQPVDIKDFGSLVNMVSPVHLKPESPLLRVVSRHVRLHEPQEEYRAFGDALCFAGITSAPAFGGNGYSDRVRLSRDGSSIMYFIELVCNDKKDNTPED